jgi:hypothetical protein
VICIIKLPFEDVSAEKMLSKRPLQIRPDINLEKTARAQVKELEVVKHKVFRRVSRSPTRLSYMTKDSVEGNDEEFISN